MNYILFDDNSWHDLLPLTFTRPVSELRIGILSIKEKWEKHLQEKVCCLTQKYLSNKFQLNISKDNILINGSICPNADLIKEILTLSVGEGLVNENILIAVYLNEKELQNDFDSNIFRTNFKKRKYAKPYLKINQLWDIFSKNGEALLEDFQLLTSRRKSMPLSKTNKLLGKSIFIEEGAKIECSNLNTLTGPIYIGKDAEVMEGCAIRGPFALCEHAVLKLGAKVYGPTTLGPYSKAGGELNNVVILANSNKAHDGFLGNSVIGEWCNIGADSNTSNLKNNYANVKLWNYTAEKFIDTQHQFCGLIMGDHSKCGINTMFNTGTVVGVYANIFGSGFPRTFIPSFSWGGAQGFITYELLKTYEVTERVFKRRNKVFDKNEKEILEHIFRTTAKNRIWEKSEEKVTDKIS